MAYSTKEKRKAYGDSPDGRAKLRARQRKYNNSVKGKATKAREMAKPEMYGKHRARIAAASRYARTGITQEMFDSMLALQDNKCAVCSNPFTSTIDAHADHDHGTGKPRGILCRRCNLAEGLVRGVGLLPASFGERLQRYIDHPTVELLDLA